VGEAPAVKGWVSAGKAARSKGCEGGAPSAGRFLQFFNKNTQFCAYFGQNNNSKKRLKTIKSV